MTNSRKDAWVTVIAVVPPVLLCAAVALQPWIPPADLFRDPLAVAYDAAAKGECCHAYYGFISLLSGLLWCVGASVACLAATVLYANGSAPGAWRFFASAGALTAMLTVDDVFQGHEFVYSVLFGIPETITVGVYAVLLAVHLWCFRQRIIALGPGLLAISLVAFTIAVLADLLVPPEIDWQRLAEDGTKLLGICTWTVFHWRAAWIHLVTDRGA